MALLTAKQLRGLLCLDEKAIGALHRQYTPALKMVAHRFIERADDVEDIVQECWVRALNGRERFRNAGPFEAWLFSICRNLCLESLRKRRNECRRLVTYSRAAKDEPSGVLPEVAEAEALEREDRLRELQTWLEQQFVTLSARQRSIAESRWVRHRSTVDVANELGVAEGTVKATLHQVRSVLIARYDSSSCSVVADRFHSDRSSPSRVAPAPSPPDAPQQPGGSLQAIDRPQDLQRRSAAANQVSNASAGST